jgi:hypothetical protein
MTLPVSFWFVALMILAGGFIAWYGDHLGRIIGKSRRTIHKKIRPKTFASIMTFAFGSLATLLTIVTLSVIAEPIRTWIIEGNAARDRLAKVSDNLKAAESKLTETESKLKSAESTTKSLNANLADKNKKLAETTAEQKSLLTKNQQLSGRANQLDGRVGLLSSQVKKVSMSLNAAESKRTALEKANQIGAETQQKYIGQNAKIQNRNLELEKTLLSLEKESNAIQSELEKLKKEANALRFASSTANDNFNRQLDTYRKELSQVQQQLEATKSQLDLETTRLESRQAQIDRIESGAFSSKLYPMIYGIKDEVARVVIPPRLNLSEATSYINNFFTRIKEIAREKGATRTEEGDYAGFLTDIIRGLKVSPEDQQRALAQAVVGRRNDSVIIVTSKFNAFKGQFVPIEVAVFPNLPVYEPGDVIYSMQIDGRKSVAEIASDMSDLIENNLPKILIGKEMIPVVGSPRPFGEISNQKIIEIALEVKEVGRPIRVQLIATKKTFSADTLTFGHRLRP